MNMFTGLIEEVGRIIAVQRRATGYSFTVGGSVVTADLSVGGSIAVNGVCLTATAVAAGQFVADAVPETLARSTLQYLRAGDPVNLERALLANSRLGGHMVAGHVDGTGVVRRVFPDGEGTGISVGAGGDILRYVVKKGSIAVDGISLTVAAVTNDDFRVSVIPHTVKVTALRGIRPGKRVNLEVDMVGKYIERQFGGGRSADGSSLSFDRLRSLGF